MFTNIQLLKEEIQIHCIWWENILSTKIADDVRHLFWNKVHRMVHRLLKHVQKLINNSKAH